MNTAELCEMRNRARQRGGQDQTTESSQQTVSSSTAAPGGTGDFFRSALSLVTPSFPVRAPELPDISKETQLQKGFMTQDTVQSIKNNRGRGSLLESAPHTLVADGVTDLTPNSQAKRGYAITKEQALASYGTVNELEPQIRQREQQIQTDYEGLLSQEREIRRMEKRLELLKKNYDTDPSQVNATIWNEAYAYYTQLYQDYTNKQNAYGSAYQEYSHMVSQYESSAKTYNDYISMFYRDDGSLDYELLAENAELERDKYLASPERAQFVAQQLQKALEDTRNSYLKGGTSDPGYVPGQGYGYLEWKNGATTPVDSKKRELESVAAYYRQQADLQYDQDLLDQRLAEIDSWTPEEKQALEEYIRYRSITDFRGISPERMGEFQAAEQLLKDRFGEGLDNYVRAIGRYKNAERMQSVRDWAEESSDGFGGGLLHSIGSVGANLVSTVTSPIGAVVSLAQGSGEFRTLDPNNPLYTPSVYASTVRGNVAKNIEESWAGKIGSALYQAGGSAVDNLARIAVGGEVGSLILAGTGSFGQTVQEASAQGATPLQATIRGIGAGALEVLTEKVSLDRLLKDVAAAPDNVLEILKRAMTSGLVEVSEEELNFLGNILLETAVMQGKDSYTTRIGELVAGGMSYQEAASTENRELVGEAVNTAVQSALSGGMMGGATNTYAYVKDGPNRKAVKALKLQEGDVEAMIKGGLETDPDTASYQVADMMQKKLDQGQPLSNSDILLLQRENGWAIQAEEEAAEDLPDDTVVGDDQTDDVAGDATDPGGLKLPELENDTQAPGNKVTVQPGVQVDTARMETAKRLSNLTGRSIVFYSGDNQNHNGYYNHKDGRIYINIQGKQMAQQVFAHELTHGVESAGAYEQLQQAAFSWMESRGVDIDSQRQEIRNLYAREGVQLKTQKDVDYEIVARFVEQNLLTDEQSIRDVVRYDRSLGRKILNWIDKLLAKFQNRNALERALLEKARAAYAKALQQTQTSFTQETATDSVSRTERQPDRAAARDTKGQAPRTRQAESVKTGDSETDRELEELADLRNRGLMDDKTYRWNVQQVLDEHRQRQSDRAAEPRELRLREQFEDTEGFEDDEDFEDYYETVMHDAEVDGTAVSHSFGGENAGTADLEDEEIAGTAESYSVAEDDEVQGLSLTGVEDGIDAYRGRSLTNDGEIYTYDFLTSLPDMASVELPEVDEVRDENGRISAAKVVSNGMKNALSVGVERAGKMYVTNRYTGRDLRIDVSSIRHGLNGDANRILTNARLGSVIGELVCNAVPINALHNTAEGVAGTYAMAGYAIDSKGREFIAIVTVEQRSGTVSAIEAYDVAHAISGRQKRSNRPDTRSVVASKRGSQASTKLQGVYPIKPSSTISIASLLDIVKMTYQSILSDNVLLRLDEVRNPKGHYTGRVRFSVAEDDEVAGLSLSGVEDDQDSAGAQESRRADDQRQGHSREALPAKARDFLARAERKLVKKLSEGLMDENATVPKAARTERLMPIVQKISEEYLRTGALDQDLANELFDWTFAESVVRDSEFYDQYKEVRNRLRSTAVTLSRQDQGDIPDFNLWRKSASGTLKIVNQGGLPVDTFYDELHSMAPELFPESITHPADQLQRMYQVGQSIRVTERSLQEYFGPETERRRQWARYNFDNAMNRVLPDLHRVRRHGEEAAARAAREAAEVPATLEEVVRAYAQLKVARKDYERAAAKWLPTQEDEQIIGRLLRGEISPESLDPETDGTTGILAVYEAKRAYEEQAKVIAKYKKKLHADRRAKADTMLETVRNWKDKRSGIAYSRETMRRNILDIVPDRALAEQILKEYFDPIQIAEAASTRFRTKYRDRVRQMGLSRKVDKKAGNIVSEAHAVQLLGEAMDNIEYLRKRRKYKGQEPERGGKTMEEWQAAVDDLWANNPGLDAGKIEGAVREFRKIYDDLFQQMNEARIRNGYEPINYLQGYFPHFQPGDGDGILAAFGRGLGIDTQVAALPTTINGLTHTFRPGIQWFGNAQERLGFNTAYDAVEGFDKYIEGVASVIHHTDNIQNLRALATQIRYNASDEGIKRQVDAVRNDDRLTEEEKKAVINGIYDRGKYALSNFVTELDEYTNLLANKKSRLDRTTEALLGRRFYAFAKWWENRVGANMIAGNIGSAVTNIIPITQAMARVGKRNMVIGMWQTLSNMKNSDGFAGQSDFITNRRGSDTLVTTGLEKASKAAGILMEGIDNFVSESITRAAYRHYLQQGFSEAEALHQADIFAAGVLGDRSKGAMPTLFSSTNPVFKAFTQFQLEVNNQFSEVFKDLPREARDKFPDSKSKRGGALLGVLLQYFVGAFLFNDLFEELFGRRPALDPLGMLNNTVGDITGYELPNLIGMWEGGITQEDFQTERVGVGEAVSNLTTEALGNLPFSSGLTLMGIELDGGRIPASSAVPNLADIWQAATTEGWSGEKRWKEIQDELNKLAYIVPPFGGNQIQKIWKGTEAFIKGGSYSVDKDGNDILQYPIFKDGGLGDYWTAAQAALFGKSSLDEAQDWVDSGFNSLSDIQTAIYQDLLDADVDDRDAYALLRDLEGAQKTETQSRAEVQREILWESDISGKGKAIVYYGLLASRPQEGQKTLSEQELMDQLADGGADEGEVAIALLKIHDAEKLKGAEASCAKRNAIMDAVLTDEEKIVLYRAKVSDSRDDDINLFQATGMDFDLFLEAHNQYATINEMDATASSKATAFARWVSGLDVTEEQADVVRDSFKFYSMVPGSTDRYDDMISAGMDPDDAYDLTGALNELQPEDGEDEVSNLQRWRASVDFSDNPAIQMAALAGVMTPSQYTKFEIAHDMDVTPDAYVHLYEIRAEFDADGNDSYTNAEIRAAIDSMTDYDLTNEQKAVLWQLMTGSTSARNNPYSTKVGQQVIDARKAAKEE